uniref:hypothetical protein n=1 Tax=Acetatifactor sp. TaxID=1872090 RepID=UPI00405665A0
MDTFMDKLAQKLTAQEMIKANTAADAEEMNKLKSQVQEYQEILDRMKQLVEESAAKIENAKVDGSEINRLVEAGIAKISEIQVAAQDNEKMQDALMQLKQSVDMRLNDITEDWNELEQTFNSKLNHTNESIIRLENVIGEKVENAINAKMEGVSAIDEKLECVSALGAKVDAANENIHKECVKVYRNVQAAVGEENTKQSESIVAAVKELKGKLAAIFGVSIAALVIALGGVVFQLLVYLQVI